MTILLSENFNKADNATTVGSPQTGPAPTILGTGVMGIQNNEAYRVSGEAISRYEVGTADFTATLKIGGSTIPNTSGLVFRIIDINNMYLLNVDSGTLILYRRVGSTSWGSLFSWGAGSAAIGDTIGVRCIGECMQFFRNGNPTYNYISNTHITGTGVGLRFGTDTTARFDDLLVEDNPMSYYTNLTAHVYKGRDTAAADGYGDA